MQSVKRSRFDSEQLEQKLLFEKEGFLGPFKLEHLIRLETLRDALDQAVQELQEQQRDQSGIWARRIAHTTSKLVYALATEPQILDDVANLLGPNVLFWMEKTIWREPGHDSHIVKSTGQIWHIDVINAWADITDMAQEKIDSVLEEYKRLLPYLEELGLSV